MPTKTEVLDEIGILDDIRQSFLRINQNEPETWEAIDTRINSMTNDDLIGRYCQWEIGDANWWYSFKSRFDRLEKHNPDPK